MEFKGENVCPECFHDPERKVRGGGIIREYEKKKDGVKWYVYRCEQKKADGSLCAVTVEKVLEFQRAKKALDAAVIMEQGYLNNASRTTKDEDFGPKIA